MSRDRALAAYHHYELASGAVQIAIVLASASIITGMTVLVWTAVGLGVVGIVFCSIGFFCAAGRAFVLSRLAARAARTCGLARRSAVSYAPTRKTI